MKKLFLPILLIAGMIPFASHAVCTKYGFIERITAYNDGVGTYHYIYMRPSALASSYFYTRTSDDEMAEMAASALTSTTRVSIQGDLSACTTSSWIGNMRYMIINP